MHAGKQPPPVNRMTHRCKNITLPKFRLWAVIMKNIWKFTTNTWRNPGILSLRKKWEFWLLDSDTVLYETIVQNVEMIWKGSWWDKTRKYSNRMRTARLPTVLASVATRCQTHGGRGVGFSSEQVWSGLQWWPPNVTSGGGGRARVGSLMSDLMRGGGPCRWGPMRYG